MHLGVAKGDGGAGDGGGGSGAGARDSTSQLQPGRGKKRRKLETSIVNPSDIMLAKRAYIDKLNTAPVVPKAQRRAAAKLLRRSFREKEELSNDAEPSDVLKRVAEVASIASTTVCTHAVLYPNHKVRDNWLQTAFQKGDMARLEELQGAFCFSTSLDFFRAHETWAADRQIGFAFLEVDFKENGTTADAHALGLFSIPDRTNVGRRRFVLYDPHDRPTEYIGSLYPASLRKLKEALKLRELYFLCGKAKPEKGRCRELVFEFIAKNAGDLEAALRPAAVLKNGAPKKARA